MVEASAIEGILPTLGRDIERFGLLRDSLKVHAGDMSRCVVVVPDADIPAFEAVIGDDPFYDLRSESAVLGRKMPKYIMHWAKKRPCRAGWYTQQLIKLACVAQSSSQFCMTLDADLVAVNRISSSKLVIDGKAIDQVTDCGDQHGAWYAGSTRVLGGMKRSGVEHPVTPTLMSSHACRLLIQYLVGRMVPLLDRDWIDFLLKRAPWSEYTLYYTYLENMGLFDNYHTIVDRPVIYDPYKSVWYKSQMDEKDKGWGDIDAMFVIVQSTAGISSDYVRAKLGIPS